MSTALETAHFGPEDVVQQRGEILVVRATPPPTAESPAPVEEDQFILPASTAPALLQTAGRPKRARGQTLNYKPMHEGKQTMPKRGRAAK
jgi:hypothetical protein